MVDRDLGASKLGELAEHLARVRTRRTLAVEDLRRDRDALDLVAFNHAAATSGLADLEAFAREVATWAQGQF